MSFWDRLKGKDHEDHNIDSSITLPFFLPFGAFTGKICAQTEPGQAAAYLRCSAVRSIINKKSLASQNAKIWAIDDEGNDVKRKDLILSMSQPNPYKTLMQFVGQVSAMCNIFGKAYIYEIKGIGVDAREIYLIPNTIIRAVKTTTFVNHPGFVPNANVDYYTIHIFGQRLRLEKDEVYEVNDISHDLNCLFGSVSRLSSLDEEVNTLVASNEAVTELMHNRGMLGIISLSDPSTPAQTMANLPLLKTEKDDIQKGLRKYGTLREQFKYLLTTLAAKFVPVSSTIKDLGTSEIQKDVIKRIADTYNVPSILLDMAGSTFSNMSEAKKVFYTDAIIPETNNIFDVLNKIYGNTDIKVMPFYDHLECFQDAKRANAAGYAALIKGIKDAVDIGLLTIPEGRERLFNYES